MAATITIISAEASRIESIERSISNVEREIERLHKDIDQWERIQSRLNVLGGVDDEKALRQAVKDVDDNEDRGILYHYLGRQGDISFESLDKALKEHESKKLDKDELKELKNELKEREEKLEKLREELKKDLQRLRELGIDPKQPLTADNSQEQQRYLPLYYNKENHEIQFRGKGSQQFQNIGLVQGSEKITPQHVYDCNELTQAFGVLKDGDDQIPVDTFLGLVSSLHGESTRSATRSAIHACNSAEFNLSKSTNVGEMAFQQMIYSSFAMLFIAASDGLTNHYAADQDINCSLHVKFKDRTSDDEYSEGIIKIQPDAAVTNDRLNAFGIMEIKSTVSPSNKEHLIDLDKCVIMTAATAILLVQCFPEDRENVVLPFIVATGRECSLYVMRVTQNGVPFVSMVRLPDGFDTSTDLDCGISPSNTRSVLFVALAVLLNKFKTYFTEQKRVEFKRKARKPVKNMTNVFTKKRKSGNLGSQNESANPSSQPKRTRNESAENSAKRAAACGGKFQDVVYPFIRQICFGKDDVVIDEQTESPFYFKGICASPATNIASSEKNDKNKYAVFLKVWNTADIKASRVESEWECLCQAHNAGVPVACPVEFVKSTNDDDDDDESFWVIATEFIDQDRLQGIWDLFDYATALIKAVQALHDQAHLLHCDIKPANVRWKDGAIKLIDFGHAQQMKDATWSPGTKGFEAPEIYQQQLPNSTKTDAYSVGQTILFELKKLKKEEQKVHDGDEVEQETIVALLKKVAENLVNVESSARWSLNEASKELDNFHKQKNKQRPRELGMPFPPKKLPKLAIEPLLQDAKPFHPLKCNHK